jgi:hypothetical protein
VTWNNRTSAPGKEFYRLLPVGEITTTPDTSKTYYVYADGNYRQVSYYNTDGGVAYWRYYSWGSYYYVCYEQGSDNISAGVSWNQRASAPGKAFFSTIMEALKAAATDFVAEVQNRSSASDPNRVAVVSFSNSGTIQTQPAGQSNNAYALRSVATDYSAITGAINNLSIGSGTYPNTGLKLAHDILNADRLLNPTYSRNRVVVLFTDGEPSSNSAAASAIRWSAVLKGERGTGINTSTLSFDGNSGNSSNPPTDGTAGIGATVYSIGVFTDPNASTHQFMWRVSSESPQGLAAPDSVASPDYAPANSANDSYYTAGGDPYYVTADTPEALDEIFSNISSQTGESYSSADIRDYIDPRFDVVRTDGTVIAVNDSYSIGTGANAKTFTVRQDGNGLYVEWVDQALSPETSSGAGDEVTFTGWVYVKAKDSFIGGNNVPTNVPNISGVYVDSGATNLGSFPYPLVNVPLKLDADDIEDYILLGENVPDTKAEAQAQMGVSGLTGYSPVYAWTQNSAPVTTELTALRPTANTVYTMTLNIAAPNLHPDQVAPIDPLYKTAVGTAAVNLNGITGAYTVNVVTPTFGSVTYNLFLGEKVADAQGAQNDFAAVLTAAEPTGANLTGLQTTYDAANWASHWTTYKANLVYAAALSGADGAGLGTLPANLYNYTPTAMSGTSKVNVTVTYNGTTIAAGNAAATPATNPTVTVNVVSGKLTLTKTISADYPNEAAANAAQGFVFKITRTYTPYGGSQQTETFYEVVNFNNGGSLSASRDITGLKYGTYTVTEETGNWRYTMQGANNRQVSFAHGDFGSAVNGVVSKTVSTFVNNLTKSTWFGDAAYAVNQFIAGLNV